MKVLYTELGMDFVNLGNLHIVEQLFFIEPSAFWVIKTLQIHIFVHVKYFTKR